MYDSSSDEDVARAPHAITDGYKEVYDSSSDEDSGSDDEYRQRVGIEPERAQPTRFAKIVHAGLEPRVGKKFQVDVVPLARWAPMALTDEGGHEQGEPLLVPTEQISKSAEMISAGRVVEHSTQEQHEFIDLID